MMLCKVGSEKDFNKKWIAERKFDGVRCLAICNRDSVKLQGRSGTDYSSKFPEIVESFKGCVGLFDGEICCDSFDHTSSRVHTENKLKSKLLKEQYPANFYAFDYIIDKTLLERKELLKVAIFGLNNIIYSEHTFDIEGLWEKAKKENWEGIILKNPLSKYEKKRSENWLKVKYNKFIDLEFNHYEVNPAGIRVDNGDIFVQVSGSQAVAVKDTIDQKGVASCEIKYLNETDSSKLRMPTFSKLNEN